MIEIDNKDRTMENEDRAMEVDSDEEPLSDDSGCISDCSENREEAVQRIVYDPELLALNRRTRFCTLYFYYSTGGAIFMCTPCMMRLHYVSLEYMHAARRHVIDTDDGADGLWCGNCRMELYQTLPQNICPVCTV